jgi:hypothetical protein
MSNRQLHNLTPISNSIDSADLFVVVDKSELTTHAVPLGDLSDALDGTIFLSSSYALTSSISLNERLAPNLIGSVSYNFPGFYQLTGLTIGKEYSWIKGVNDTSLVNVLQTLTDSGRFTAGAVNVAITGTSLAAVTAQVYEYPRSGVDTSQFVTNSSYSHVASGSAVFAWSSSFAVSSSYSFTHRDLLEITFSGDTLNILTSPVGNATMSIRVRAPVGNSYVIKPITYTDILGSRVISPSSNAVTYFGLPSNSYEFEVSKLDSVDRSLRFGVTIPYNPTPTLYYSEFIYFSPGGAQNASGPNIWAISASLTTTSSALSNHSLSSISSSLARFASNGSGSGISAISSSMSVTATWANRSRVALTSSNGPLPGMILIYAGVFLSGSNNWFNCDGRSYSQSLYPSLSSSFGSKFTDGVISDRLPKITTNLPTSSGGSGPYNSSINRNFSQITSSGPANYNISMSYAVAAYITGSYPDGTIVYGTNMGPSGSAFYYNVKR